MPEILFFPFFGPNRRSDSRVIEIRLDFSLDDHPAPIPVVSRMRQRLLEAGFLADDEPYPREPLPEEAMTRYSSLLVQTAVLLQRANGHRVDFFSVTCEPDDQHILALVEHEHSEVGMAAVRLAIELTNGKMASPREGLQAFSRFAQERCLPLETETIIKAARKRQIPVFQLEREPLTDKLKTGFRVRRNGLLLLGHGATHHVIDGAFCVDRADSRMKALLRNPGQRMDLLRQLQVPITPKKASVPGVDRQFHLYFINGKTTVLEQQPDRGPSLSTDAHESLSDICRMIGDELGSAPLMVRLKTRDLTKSLTETGGTVEDFDLAPDLEPLSRLVSGELGLIERVVDDLINWLFPNPATASMPVFAITGTNGKTTTSRMITQILQYAGRRTGLVCSDGIYLDGKLVNEGDACTFIGHSRALTSRFVDSAVLESHHRGIAVRGFAFHHCDIAVCLNVTKEHLQDGEIETVEQMAEIKRALIERASTGAVLFADDSHCMEMLDYVEADTTCLVSLRSNVVELGKIASQAVTCFCVLEAVDDSDWIVLYDSNRRLPVLEVNDIPATIDGTARFNVSNAMHAIAATYLEGIKIDGIREAMQQFTTGFDSTPGRLNIYDALPFRVIIDFAHNADGFRKLCEFIDFQSVSGRKILVFGIAETYRDADIVTAVSELAGHFDHYFCVNSLNSPHRAANEIPDLLASGLQSAGVPQSDISLVLDTEEWWRNGLTMAEPGDLLVLLPDNHEVSTILAVLDSMAV
jgi:UDP-N-acetylmuramyl tripeptide synthase